MIDVNKMHFGPRENNISVLGQRKLHTNFELDIRGPLNGNLHFGLGRRSRLRGQGEQSHYVLLG